jgi:hypothetical protein
MSWKNFKTQSKIIEEHFSKCLINPKWADSEQDMFEHWDIEGELNGKLLKFDVKGRKKINRLDVNYQDNITWVEETNVHGKSGWIKGKADIIVFERCSHWLLVNREELLNLVNNKLKENNYKKGKGIYMIYQRTGRKDKITMVPFQDIEQLTRIQKIDKK